MSDYRKNKARLYGLLFECPFDPEKSKDCRLSGIRQKPLDERIEWADSLSEKEVEDIVTAHEECLWKKEHE